MKKRILLQERAELSQALIDSEINFAKKFKTLLELLKECGLELTKVDNWENVETELRKKFQFPSASIEFNLEALGISRQYRSAKQLYDGNLRGRGFIDEVNNKRIEEIKDQYRVYTTNENQLEAYNLIISLAKDLNRAKELGIRFEFCFMHQVNSELEYEKAKGLVVNKKRLAEAVLRIK